MFGYIRPCKAELRIKEFEAFRAVYCGLCHQLGRSFGPLARLTLNYDFVFLAMIAYSQSDTKPVITRGRCAVNPLKRVPVCHGDSVLEFSSDCAALMIYYNLLDKIEDGGIFTKLGYSLLRPFASTAQKKASDRQPGPAGIIRELSDSQRLVEKTKGEVGVDPAAEPTAKALSEIFKLLSEDAGQKRVLERLGYLTGRYIYLCDALDDLESDIKSGSFNPLAQKFLGGGVNPEAMKNAREYAKDTLFMTVGEAGRTCGLLEMKVFAPVIENIVYMGMSDQVGKIAGTVSVKPFKELDNERSV